MKLTRWYNSPGCHSNLATTRRFLCVDHLQAKLDISERRARGVVGQHRSTQRKTPCPRSDEDELTMAIIRLASQYGRYGYRRVWSLLRTAGRHVNVKRAHHICRWEALKVPQKQAKRGRLWLNDGSSIRLRPSWPNHVWSYDFVMDRTHDGKAFRMLTVIDEFNRRSLRTHSRASICSLTICGGIIFFAILFLKLYAGLSPPDAAILNQM